MNLDWRRLKAVVLESDDWGLAAWSPDEQAHRVLVETPAFRTAAGQHYGRSTLESAADVRALVSLLRSHRGADGEAPVWQANTIVATPDYANLAARPEATELPILAHPFAPARWQRPGLWEEVHRAERDGVWWAELHGLHHLPERAWLDALQRGDPDARVAFEQQSPICQAVEAGTEFGPAEPLPSRARQLDLAIRHFHALFGRAPSSFCPPDYGFDAAFEDLAEARGLTTLQGKAEQTGAPLAPLRRRALAWRFPHRRGARFYLPPRIAFEPRGAATPTGRVGTESALRAARAAWHAGRPAVLSTHRANYAHLDAAWSEAGRAALDALIAALCAEGATFLVDAEVRQLCERGASLRPVGRDAALVRWYGAPHEPFRVAAPAGATAAYLPARGATEASLPVADGAVVLRAEPGAHRLEWSRA